jgi:hypothetical protein
MKLSYYKRSVYGTIHHYPACDKAKAIAAMLGTKTLPFSSEAFRNFGYAMDIVWEQVNDPAMVASC